MSRIITETQWTSTEIEISQRVLKTAYQRETETLVTQIRHQINNLTEMEQLWQIHDILSAKRYDLDGKYDARESMLIFTFAQLLKEGWISLEELQGLDPTKLAKVSSLSKM
ncbi:hypothetical protein [Geminocystis sp. NIES-3709]|uniref:hypothetical protein n=1 Tax=Geminocystis sp. NIES-3709 TaxID=1617448 RepID=UPI0005FCD4A2|nr:hypothetical protein [Geminocystis sp. NIES-3709]BAQ65685.1 hypothetical protein GM3709_2450 [Geminocystis sp. NIES-3709]